MSHMFDASPLHLQICEDSGVGINGSMRTLMASPGLVLLMDLSWGLGEGSCVLESLDQDESSTLSPKQNKQREQSWCCNHCGFKKKKFDRMNVQVHCEQRGGLLCSVASLLGGITECSARLKEAQHIQNKTYWMSSGVQKGAEYSSVTLQQPWWYIWRYSQVSCAWTHDPELQAFLGCGCLFFCFVQFFKRI